MSAVVEINMARDHEIYVACQDLVRNNPILQDMNYVPLDNSRPLLHMVANLFEEHDHGINQTEFTDKNATVEIHQYIDNDGTHKSPLCIHMESGGDFQDTETFVCYLMNNGQGGEFGVYETEDPESLIAAIDTHPKQDSVKCLIFNETLYHAPLPFAFGQRLIVSIHISRGKP
jgi:hypothetical protein